jgi:hypothetical protein
VFTLLTPTTLNSGNTVTYMTEPQARKGLDLACKNVDLQTGGFWACAVKEPGGYVPLSLQSDVKPADALRGGKIGWFFPIPNSGTGLRWMFDSSHKVQGSVINLNPSCFGEVYWVGGAVGGVDMAFAVWLPYSRWVTLIEQERQTPLPVFVHFRPNYDLTKYGYGEAAQWARAQNVQVVLGRDSQQMQPFLSAAWYYFVGPLAFVQQLLAVQRLAVLVMPIPPPTNRGILHPDAFFTDFKSILLDVVSTAVGKASLTGAGSLLVRDDYFILTANSHGGLYLMNAVRTVSPAGLIKEIWLFDTDYSTMLEAKNIGPRILRRLYIAQAANRGTLFAGGQGDPNYEQQTSDWSAVDITSIPSMGTSLHDYCGRFCFSHAASLSPGIPALKPDSRFNQTLQQNQCWPDRQEVWYKR